jgi:tagatose-1,6-bisphosphate aldolase
MPEWTDLQWRFASAAAAAHGVSSLLCGRAGWSHPGWRDFVAAQRSHF